MLKLINSIGQRKLSRILFFISIFTAIVCFVINSGLLILINPLTWLGIFLMSAPIGFLCWGAHKTKDYRMLCLLFQPILILINSFLYFKNIPEFFFILTILETFVTLGLSVLFTKKKPLSVNVKRKTINTNKSLNKESKINE